MSMNKPTGGEKLIAETLIKIQKSNEKATKQYLIITIAATFASTISGILIGKYLLS